MLETAQPPGGALGSKRGPQAHSERSHLAWCVPTGDGALALTQAPPPLHANPSRLLTGCTVFSPRLV